MGELVVGSFREKGREGDGKEKGEEKREEKGREGKEKRERKGDMLFFKVRSITKIVSPPHSFYMDTHDIQGSTSFRCLWARMDSLDQSIITSFQLAPGNQGSTSFRCLWVRSLDKTPFQLAPGNSKLHYTPKRSANNPL